MKHPLFSTPIALCALLGLFCARPGLVSAASPASLTPPAGWQSAAPAGPHGNQVSLAAYVLPGTGFIQNIDLHMVPTLGVSFADFVADRAHALAHSGTVVTSHPEKICNGKVDGWFMDYKVSLGGQDTEVDQTLAADANAVYMASYTRAAGQTENAAARASRDTLCLAAPAAPVPADTPAPAETGLPFKPPAGWVNMYSAMPKPAFRGMWIGPKSGNATSNVNITSEAFTGTVEQLSNRTALGAGMLQSRVAAQRSGTICSLPARFITLSKPLGMDGLVMDQSMYVSNGTAYTLTYTRTVTQPADPQIQQLLGNLCPEQIESGKIAFPPGWSVNEMQTMRLAGMWMDPKRSGQVINLISTPYAGTLESFMVSAAKNSAPSGARTHLFTVLSQRNGTLCGLPARFVSMKGEFGSISMRIDQEATIYGGKAYLVTYGRMNGQPADAVAVNSMKSLCPK